MNSDSSARIGGQYFRSPSFSQLPFIPTEYQQEPYVSVFCTIYREVVID
jgi:hypothetical protein